MQCFLPGMKVNKLFLCFLLSITFVSLSSGYSYIKDRPIQPPSNYDNVFNIYYKNNSLIVKGININGNLKIYSIIGNIILDINVQNLSNVLVPVDLIKQNMYIVRIETSQNRIITRKIVAR